MVASYVIEESNGAGETKTTMTSTDMGSVESVHLDPVANPITAGNNSYEKYHKLKFTAAGGSSSVRKFKMWADAVPGTGVTHLSNCRESSYGGAETYATPVATASSKADVTVPVTQPTGANFGYGGTLDAVLDLTSGLPKYSDYIVMQLQTTGSATAGKTMTMSYQWDEIA